MKLVYVDETGIDGVTPFVVMVGVIVDGQRLGRTRQEFRELFAECEALAGRELLELKAADLHRGRGAWGRVPGPDRADLIGRLCQWLVDRKHLLALAAIDTRRAPPPPIPEVQKPWPAVALHIALQVQRVHQRSKQNKGSTLLVFDDNKREADPFAEVIAAPPAWSDAFYDRGKRQEPLDQLMDSVFYAKSHHIGLLQIADLYAFILRRHCEFNEGAEEKFGGEAATFHGWAELLCSRLLPRADRWPRRTRDACSTWYAESAPTALLALD